MNKHIKLAFSRIARAPYQAMAAILVMSMTMLLAGIFLAIGVISQILLVYFETRPQINAYFNQELSPQPQQIELIKASLLATGKVEDVKYVSKEQAFEEYKQQNASDSLLVGAVTSGILPASLSISVKDPKFMREIAEDVKKEVGIDEVRFEEEIVDTLSHWTDSVRFVGLILVGTHGLITLLVVLLVIGIKVSSRREEISTLRLLGASKRYITAPFVIEGVIYGVAGAFLAWLVILLGVLYTTSFWKFFLDGIMVLSVSNIMMFMVSVLLFELVAGVLIGSIGGLIATSRFIKS
jgi:cell division transport system permease protein